MIKTWEAGELTPARESELARQAGLPYDLEEVTLALVEARLTRQEGFNSAPALPVSRSPPGVAAALERTADIVV